MWTSRQVLESFCHKASSFVTLTYNQENLPKDGCVKPEDVKDWLKRLRYHLDENNRPKIRFYLVGEYGDDSLRPHYHASVFGLDPLDGEFVERAWINTDSGKSLGFVDVKEFNRETAQYVAGYVVKGWAREEHRDRPDGLAPEFGRMSNRPGIGADAMSVLADSFLPFMECLEDVPHVVRFNGKLWPIGRYLRDKLRKVVDMSDEEIAEIKQKFITAKTEEVCALLRNAIEVGEALSASGVLSEKSKGAIAELEAREKITRSRRTL